MYFSRTLNSCVAALTLSGQGMAALTPVSDFGPNPTNLQMSLYIPSKLATNPAVILAVSSVQSAAHPTCLTDRQLHPCGGTGQAYVQQSGYGTLADQKGFIVIYPTTTHDNHVCKYPSNH